MRSVKIWNPVFKIRVREIIFQASILIWELNRSTFGEQQSKDSIGSRAFVIDRFSSVKVIKKLLINTRIKNEISSRLQNVLLLIDWYNQFRFSVDIKASTWKKYSSTRWLKIIFAFTNCLGGSFVLRKKVYWLWKEIINYASELAESFCFPFQYLLCLLQWILINFTNRCYFIRSHKRTESDMETNTWRVSFEMDIT